MTLNPDILIHVWSDYVCPFCYLELPVLERLQAEEGGLVAIDWRAFELRPEPTPTLDPDGEYLHRVWSQSVYPMAQERGLPLKLPPVQPRSRKALEAAEHARSQGRFDDMHKALFRAFFEEGRDIDNPGVLQEIGASIGLDPDALRAALDSGQHTEKVLADQRLAQELGLTGVPAMILRHANQAGPAFLVSGAQPHEALQSAVQRLREAEPTHAPI